jgi:hypothetical protein
MALAKGSVEAWVGDPTLWPPLPGTKDDWKERETLEEPMSSKAP